MNPTPTPVPIPPLNLPRLRHVLLLLVICRCSSRRTTMSSNAIMFFFCSEKRDTIQVRNHYQNLPNFPCSAHMHNAQKEDHHVRAFLSPPSPITAPDKTDQFVCPSLSGGVIRERTKVSALRIAFFCCASVLCVCAHFSGERQPTRTHSRPLEAASACNVSGPYRSQGLLINPSSIAGEGSCPSCSWFPCNLAIFDLVVVVDWL